MATRAVKADPMEGRIARWTEVQRSGVPVMFIDSVLLGHYRMNYPIIGDTASENPDVTPAITMPHRFRIGMLEAPPGNGPAWHSHSYVELFVPLTGRWRFCYGHNADNPNDLEGETIVEPWDVISFPPQLWRRFENIAEYNAVGLVVLDPCDVVQEKDPIWPQWLVGQAMEAGVLASRTGQMIKPDNFHELEAEITARIRSGRPADSHRGDRSEPS